MRYLMKHSCHILLILLSLLLFLNPQIFAADGYIDLIVQVKDPLKRDLCIRGKINGKYIDPDIYNFIQPEGPNSWKFNRLPPYTNIVLYLYIYEGNVKYNI